MHTTLIAIDGSHMDGVIAAIYPSSRTTQIRLTSSFAKSMPKGEPIRAYNMPSKRSEPTSVAEFAPMLLKSAML